MYDQHFLPPKGRELNDEFLSGMLELNCMAIESLSGEEVHDAFRILNKMQQNVVANIDALAD